MSKKAKGPQLIYHRSRGIKGLQISYYPDGYTDGIDFRLDVAKSYDIPEEDARLSLAALAAKYPAPEPQGDA